MKIYTFKIINEYNLKISNITKIYPGCIANDNVSMEFKVAKYMELLEKMELVNQL